MELPGLPRNRICSYGAAWPSLGTESVHSPRPSGTKNLEKTKKQTKTKFLELCGLVWDLGLARPGLGFGPSLGSEPGLRTGLVWAILACALGRSLGSGRGLAR